MPRRTPKQRIRTLALAVLLHRDHLLCARGYDEVKGQTFYRPLGGGVEFGELAADAAIRELREETGRDIEVRELLGVTENVFSFNGVAGHEICFEYIAAFTQNSAPDDLEPVTCNEGKDTFVAEWLPLAEVLGGTHLVYPNGLPARLADWVNRQ